MEHRDRINIMLGVIAIFITASFNSIMILSFQWYNITNAILYCVLLGILAILYRRPRTFTHEVVHDMVALILITLAGTGIQYKNKIFLFLALFYALQFISWRFWATEKADNTQMASIIQAASMIVCATAYVFSVLNFVTIMTYFGMAVFLLMLQGFLIFLTCRVKQQPGGTIQ